MQAVDTGLGTIYIYGPVSPDGLEQLSMDKDLNVFRSPARQREALIKISRSEQGYVFIAELAGLIVGYVTFHPPERFERWAKGPSQVLELGAIEVSPSVRGHGIARRLLQRAFAQEFMEEYIVVATEYVWHWDLERTGLHVWEYRKMMRRLLTQAGMVVKDTDEDEILSHPANMLTVRYGAKVPEPVLKAFDSLLYKSRC